MSLSKTPHGSPPPDEPALLRAVATTTGSEMRRLARNEIVPRSSYRLLLSGVLAADFAAVAAAGLCSRLGVDILPLGIAAPALPLWRVAGAVALVAACTILLALLSGGYRPSAVTSLRTRGAKVPAVSLAVVAALAGCFALLVEPATTQLLWLATWGISAAAALLSLDAARAALVRRTGADSGCARRVVLYKAGSHGDAVEAMLDRRIDDVIVVATFCDTPNATKTGSATALDALIGFVQANDCDEVVVGIAQHEQALLRRALENLSVLPCDITVCPNVLNLPTSVLSSFNLGRLLMCSVQRKPLAGATSLAKAAFDTVVASAALLALLPLFAIIAIAIKLESKGPVFFKQKRNGYNQREFRVYKFRTMTVMEDGAAVRQATQDDARVTKVGRFLRRTSLDELPQLINVLRGEMSLVGPRPHAVAHNQLYGSLIGHYANRHRVKPGITGWAQVNGFRGETRDAEQMRRRVQHDLQYIENASLVFDLKILIATVRTVLSGQNAH